MSVYIKGMEMPTRCGECLLAKLSPTGESLICDYMLSRVSWDERPFDCPLVPVQPHGDLIDRDVLGKYKELVTTAIPGGKITREYVSMAAVRNVKTIIPAEGAEYGTAY